MQKNSARGPLANACGFQHPGTSIWSPGASGQLSKVNGGSVMAYDLDSMHELELAENHAFRRLYEMADLEDWEEAFGAWLKAVRILRRERVLSRVL
jgi:hypothetical protein